MVLYKLDVKNFRNLNNLFFEPGKKTNFIVGDNAQGKTNIIEAIYYQSFGKSFRTNNVNNLLNINSEFIIKSKIVNNNVSYDASIKVNSNSKKIILNDKLSKIKDISNVFKVILYYPSEINILLKSPSLRRNLIDKSIFLHDINYLDLHLDYIKCLKNRNLCLKNNKDDYIWREKLIDLSYEIVKKRLNYIEQINNIFVDNQQIFEGECYKIKYKNINIEKYKDNLKNDFLKVRNNEKKIGYTVLGQHTDTINFQINDLNIENYGSEGQKKTFLLLYKYSQLMNFYHQENYKPVLIIDDITSEIDNKRGKILFNRLLSNCNQSFITSLKLPLYYNETAEIFKINNGNLQANKGIS